MGDIDEDIERARVGKRREELHDIIHKKKAETNLPPLKSRKSKRGNQTTQNVHTVPEPSIQQMPAVRIYCKQPGCTHNNVDGWQLYTCDRCGKMFCHTHHLHDDHKCIPDKGIFDGLKYKIKSTIIDKVK